MRLKDKVAIITGAGSGFGKAMAELFAAEGAKVMVSDLNGSAAVAVAKGITDAGGTAITSACDVTSAADLAAMTDAILKAFGKIDVLVNNAGFPQRNGSMFDVDEATFDKIFNVNVKSLYLTTKEIVPHLIESQGNVVNIASTAALSPRRVRVNALCPVFASTGMSVEFMGGVDTQEIRNKFVSTIPLGRENTPRDLAHAALWLASDDASFITGVALEVDGGRCV